LLAFVAAAFGAMVSAQDRPVAFPHGATTGSFGNWAPLGEICSPYGNNAAESRTHALIPAEFLPPRPGFVWALEHIPVWLQSTQYPCTSTGATVQYALLEITLAHRARGAGPLSTTFANNLPSPPPAPVFPAQPITIAWTLGSWSPIQFAQPFAYDGTSDIVVEIRKVVTPTGQNVGTLRNLEPVRPDLPRPVLVTGVSGSGAHNAATGSYGNPLGWRLRFDYLPEPTLEARSPLGANGHYTNGDIMHFRIFATPGDLFVLAASFGFLPAPIVVPPFQGGIWLLPPITILDANLVAPAPGTNHHRFDLPIPPDPALAGLRIMGQSAVLRLATGQWDMTNAVDFVIR
jgi:hypothetical protein